MMKVDLLLANLDAIPVTEHNSVTMLTKLIEESNIKTPAAVRANNVACSALLHNGLLMADLVFNIRNADGTKPEIIQTTIGKIINPMMLCLSSNHSWGARPVGDYIMDALFVDESVRLEIFYGNTNVFGIQAIKRI